MAMAIGSMTQIRYVQWRSSALATIFSDAEYFEDKFWISSTISTTR